MLKHPLMHIFTFSTKKTYTPVIVKTNFFLIKSQFSTHFPHIYINSTLSESQTIKIICNFIKNNLHMKDDNIVNISITETTIIKYTKKKNFNKSIIYCNGIFTMINKLFNEDKILKNYLQKLKNNML